MSSSHTKYNWLSFAPILFVGLWATGFIGSRLSAPYAEPLSFLSIRFAIVALILIAVSLIFSAKWPDRRTAGWALLTGGFLHGGYLGGVFWVIYHGMPAGVAALITSMQPLLTSVLAGILLGEVIRMRQWAGLVIGLLGVAMAVWPGPSFSSTGITPLTLGVCALATLSITVGSILQKRYLGALDIRSGNALQFLGGMLVVLVGALLGEDFEITWNADVVFAMIWLVFALSMGAISLLYLMIRHDEVSKVSSLFYLVPSVTSVFAFVLFDERLSPVQLVGMLVCAGAVFLVATRSQRAR